MAKVATNQERLNELFDADPRNDVAIAHSLGVSKQTISAWRNGTRSPKRSMVAKIAEYYNCSVEWLFGWDMPSPSWISEQRNEAPTAKVGAEFDKDTEEFIRLFQMLSCENH